MSGACAQTSYLYSSLPCGGVLRIFDSAYGGLVWFFLGWVIPDAVILLIAYGMASILSKKLIACIPISIGFTLLFVALINVNQLEEYILAPKQEIGYEIIKKIELEQNSLPRHKIAPKDLVYKTYPNILLPKFIIGGDEGCMCMYFRFNNRETYLSVLHKRVVHGLGRPSDVILPRSRNALYTVSLKRSDDESKLTYDLLFEIVENEEVTARFWQRGIPEGAVSTKTYSRDDKLEKDFFENASELLLRNTFIASLISGHVNLSYFPSEGFDKFLSEAMH